VLILALGIALAFGIQDKLEDSALHQQAQYTRDQVDSVLIPALRHEDIQSPWIVGSARYTQLDNLILATMIRDHVVRVKIWRPDGTILYSDATDLIGQQFEPEEDLAEALAGETHMDISDLTADENEFEVGEYTRLLEVYVPLRSAGSTTNTAIFETYHDLAATDALNDEMRGFLWTVLTLGLVILYASLFTIVFQASRTIARRNRENSALYREVSQRLAERIVVEQTLRERVETERLILAISTNFINIPSHEVDNGVRQTLRALGNHMDVDRTYLLQFNRATDSLVINFEWCKSGVVPLAAVLGNTPNGAMPLL
jgi:hypothetical protein